MTASEFSVARMNRSVKAQAGWFCAIGFFLLWVLGGCTC